MTGHGYNLLIEHEGEVWKNAIGFPGYMVSNSGRVKSLRKEITMSYPHGSVTKIYQERILPGYIKRQRHRPVAVMVTLRRDNRPTHVRVHHLVLFAFVGPRPIAQEACHNDGDPTNNKINNLRWDSHAGNVKDMDKHGTRSNPPVHMGEAHPRASLTLAQARHIKAIQEWPRGHRRRLAKELMVSEKIISDVRLGKSWRHA